MEVSKNLFLRIFRQIVRVSKIFMLFHASICFWPNSQIQIRSCACSYAANLCSFFFYQIERLLDDSLVAVELLSCSVIRTFSLLILAFELKALSVRTFVPLRLDRQVMAPLAFFPLTCPLVKALLKVSYS